MYEYNGKVTGVTDVETVTVRLEIGFRICVEQQVKLFGISGIDASTDHTNCRAAKDRLKSYILDKHVIVKTYKYSDEIYLADIYIETSHGLECVNDWLVKEKLAKYRSSKIT